MAVPWAKRLSGRAGVYHFPPTNGPIMLLAPNRAGVPIYGQPRATVVFMAPPVAPLPPPPPTPRPPVPPLARFYNTEQTCVSTCPDGTSGDPIIVTIDAGTISSTVSVASANAQAMADACAEADRLRELTPCEETPSIELTQEYQRKTGTVECDPTAFASENPPVNYSAYGTADGCADSNGKRTIAFALCVPVSINEGAGEINYRLAAEEIVRATFNIGCGVPYQVNVTAYPANGAPSTDVGSGVGGITLLRAPEFNPYTFILSVKFDLVGTRVSAADSAVEIDVSKVQFVGCLVAVEGVIVDSGIPWESVGEDDAVSVFEPDEANENATYNVAQIRVTASGLVAGQGYRFAIIFATRAAGSADPFVPVATPVYVYFEAPGVSYTSDWIDVPATPGLETKFYSASVTEVAPVTAEIPTTGATLVLGFDGPATFGAGGNGGFALEMDDGPVTLTYVSGSGTNELTFSLSRNIYALDGSGVLAYTNPGNGLLVSAVSVPSFGFFGVVNSSSLIPPPDISWIKFDEGSGTAFAGAVGSGGTLSSSAMWVAGPAGGFAIQGDGVGRYGVTSGVLNFGSAAVITVFLRVKPNNLAATAILVEGSSIFNNNTTFAIYTEFGGITFVMTSGPNAAQYYGINGVTSGAWNDLMIVFNRNLLTIQVWLNGTLVLVPTINVRGLDLNTTFQDYVFNFLARNGSSLFADAAVDDFRVWTGDKSPYVDLVDADT